MVQIDVQVNGRSYALVCDEGQQEHLRALARDFDKRVRDLAASAGPVADARLMLMAGLMLKDELEAAHREIAALQAERAMNAESQAKAEDELAGLLDGAAERIESIAASIARP